MGGIDWIYLAQDRDQWRALVNTVRTFGFYKMFENSCVPERLAAFEEGLSSMELVMKSTTFMHSIRKCSCTFPDSRTYNRIRHILKVKKIKKKVKLPL
jgi:hypothetical protein